MSTASVPPLASVPNTSSEASADGELLPHATEASAKNERTPHRTNSVLTPPAKHVPTQCELNETTNEIDYVYQTRQASGSMDMPVADGSQAVSVVPHTSGRVALRQ